MRSVSMVMISLGFMAASGCNGAKSPDAVASNVAAAEQKSSNEVAKSETQASKDLGSAADKVDDKLVNLNNVAAKDSYKVALAQADGDLKVALAKCTALDGTAQKNCKDQANADYDAVKASAKADSVAQKQ